MVLVEIAIKTPIPLSSHSAIDETIVDETARRIDAVRTTPEAREGLSAFLEKHQPA